MKRQEKIIKVPKITKMQQNTVVQDMVQPVELEKPKIIKKTIQRKQPVIKTQVKVVTKNVEVHRAERHFD